MKRINVITGLCVLSALSVLGTTFCAAADTGLLLVAHGAPSPAWNEPVLQFGERVAKAAAVSGKFSAVRTAMLEFAQPDVASQIEAMEAAGCDRIVSVPLFIAPSGHSHFDVPAVLGIYTSPSVRAVLAAEGGRAARPTVPVTLTQTLSDGTVLDEFALSQVRALSESPKEEALVLIAHGDPDHGGLCDEVMRRIATYCCGKTGIEAADWAYVAVGQTYGEHGIPAIAAAAEAKKRVLVVGLYVSSSALRIHERAMKSAPDHVREAFAGKNVLFSKAGLVDYPGTVDWVIEAASGALGQDPPGTP